MKRLILIAIALCGLTVGAALLVPETVAASPKTEICQGVGAVSAGGCSGGTSALNGIIKVVIQIFSSIIAISAVAMIMYAGFTYVTAADDSGKVGTAKKTILYAAIGLVVAAFAQSIVWFVLDRAIKADDPPAKKKTTQKTTPYPHLTYYSIEFNNKNVV